MNAPEPPKDPIRFVAGDDRWIELTQQANAAYTNQQGEAVDDLYQSALEEADKLLRSAEKGSGPAQAPAILVISHHNLAELALKRGQTDRATAHYQGAFDRLVTLAGNMSAPLELREACMSHLRIALVALVAHLLTCGAPSSKLAREIERARNAVHAARGRPC
ncbi:MAG: hypothetical protein MI824_24850 [Hyphomicrobiales bacterium]|nr:hypothetical protein [Hyphomicrobiales bacterium]